MLGRVIGMHWHALVHDVLALGYRASDILTTLTLSDMVSIVVGSGPGDSVRYFLDGKWSQEAHILANMQEGQAGIAKLQEPYRRPGITQRAANPTEASVFHAEAMTWEEMDARNIKRYTAADERAAKGIKPGNTRVRML